MPSHASVGDQHLRSFNNTFLKPTVLMHFSFPTMTHINILKQ